MTDIDGIMQEINAFFDEWADEAYEATRDEVIEALNAWLQNDSGRLLEALGRYV